MAKSFKFTKMSKKVPFLPSLHQKGDLQDGITSIDQGVQFLESRVKQSLIDPDRTYEKSKKFHLVRQSETGYISKPVGQEFDTYDEELKKYMTKLERGQPRPKPDGKGGSIKVHASTLHIPGTNGVWSPNNFLPNLLSNTKPLLDRSNTPRSAARAIACERNFSAQKWLYNKKDLDMFDPRQSKRDIERSKTLKRLSKRQEKQRTMRKSMIESIRNSSAGNTRMNSTKVSRE